MKIIVTGALQATDEELKVLGDMGLEITLHIDEREPVIEPGQYEAAICNGLFLYNKIEKFENLRYIQLTSAGTDRVPMSYVREKGIELHSASGVYSAPMAEWTVMRILELYKNAGRLFENRSWVKDRTWRELGGKTALIVGFGANGAAIAKRLKAFDVNVLAVNRSKRESPFVDRFYSFDELNEALGVSDIVIITLALNDETRGIMNAKRFAAMKDGAIFVNAARGALADEKALIAALKDKLFGAALDVFELEPLPDNSPLRQLDNVLISPHNSFVGENNHARLMALVLKNLADAEKP